MRTRMDGVHHKHRNISSAYLYETNARLYIKQRSQSSVLVKQAKKNSFKMLSSICSPDLFCGCAIFRIKHAVKNISLLKFFQKLFNVYVMCRHYNSGITKICKSLIKKLFMLGGLFRLSSITRV